MMLGTIYHLKIYAYIIQIFSKSWSWLNKFRVVVSTSEGRKESMFAMEVNPLYDGDTRAILCFLYSLQFL